MIIVMWPIHLMKYLYLCWWHLRNRWFGFNMYRTFILQSFLSVWDRVDSLSVISSEPLLLFLEVELHLIHSVFYVAMTSVSHVLGFDVVHALDYCVEAVSTETIPEQILLLCLLVLQYLFVYPLYWIVYLASLWRVLLMVWVVGLCLENLWPKYVFLSYRRAWVLLISFLAV